MNSISKLLSLLLFISWFPGLYAQENNFQAIIDPGELYSGYTFSEAEKDSIKAVLGKDTYDAIELACREDNWPAGLADLNVRLGNAERIKQYNASLLITIGDKSILEIRRENNTHMPSDMQPASAIYFVIGNKGIGLGNDVAVNNDDDFNIFEDEFPQVQIVDPLKIKPNHTFTPEEMQDIIDQLGDDGYDYIDSNCRESSWPRGMNNAENRQANTEDIKLFNAFLVAESGDISILEVTPEENVQMSHELQPENTFYIVISSDAIEIMDY